ncbi:nitroreductase family protein [Geobacter benzoatilyticus]|uniref:Nitroreductase family protein n=1 Tax=Geobacter benzoatilyticus TaxID=2815309 RepID=A0ABX7Q263_9BACT|nr:nitroreductase family protein [Geobacter benzoatilyticus]QSV45506.1 nitroreductase family protein [Geobacter benzoatilyticus]
MSLIAINHETCRRDGSCRAVCPVDLFDLDGEGFPEFRESADALCLVCGHCVAVCSRDAVHHAKISMAESPLIDSSLEVQSDALLQLLKSRRSIREFHKETIPIETIRTLIDATRWAPTAVNRQPVQWIVVHNPAEVHRLAELVYDWLRQAGDSSRYAHFIDHWEQGRDMILRGAPHVAVTVGPRDWNWSAVDCAIALTNFEIAATAHGIGTCWAGILTWAAKEQPALREALGVPDGHEVYESMMFGLPKHHYRRIPQRNDAQVMWR